jgi:hypothetical protein
MRNRASAVTWTLLGAGLGFGLVGCATEERTFGAPGTGDGGVEHHSDASVTTADPSDGGANTQGIDTDTIVIVKSDASSEPSSDSSNPTHTDGGHTVVDPTETSETPTSGPQTDDVTSEPDPETDAGPSCVAVLEVEGNCTDHVDDDCDGLYDCEDIDDCGTSLDCLSGCFPSSETEVTCNEGVDDDCDGFMDCDDVDCVHAENCNSDCDPVPEVCADNDDNDCDGFTDCADSACAAEPVCCAPSGDEICDDGVDNNCDGAIDCPVLLSAVPALPAQARKDWEGGAVAANQATLNLATPVATDYTLQCRSGKPANVNSKQFIVCNPTDPMSTEIRPLSEVDATNPAFNGVVTTQVRIAYPNGQASQPLSYTYYVHNSLAGAQPCEDRAEDQAYFDFAATYLTSGSNPFANADAKLAAPFINIAFTPLVSSMFEVYEGEAAVEYLSLRRRFVLSSDKQLILMKRVYGSRRSSTSDCLATTIRTHVNDLDNDYERNRDFRNGCHAVVMNKDGAGLCLWTDLVDAIPVVSLVTTNSDSWQIWAVENVNWLSADNFMWRKLLRRQSDSTFETFSPKCYVGGGACTGGDPNVLFLPDHNLF